MRGPDEVRGALEKLGVGPVAEGNPSHSASVGLDGAALPRLEPLEARGVAEALRFAAADGLAALPVGAGTGLGLGNSPRRADFFLGLSRLAGVLDYSPGDFTLTARAGTTLGHLWVETARHRQISPLEAPGGEWATLGGTLAAAGEGSRRLGYGPARDHLLGIAVARPDGTIAKSGGKVVKNVTGYDLGRLYAGSLGTLGVIVEATIRLRPEPKARRSLAVSLPHLDPEASFVRRLRASASCLVALDLLDAEAAEAAWGIEHGGPFVALLRFEGEPAAVETQFEAARGLAVEVGALPNPIRDPEAALLSDPRRVVSGRASLWLRATTVPSMVPVLLDRFRSDAETAGLPLRLLARAGVGVVHALVPENGAGPPEIAGFARSARDAARSVRATAVLVEAPVEVKRAIDAWGDPPEGFAVMRRLKEAFDPGGVLNPGRFVGGL